jgi:alpha-L-rhamnosidase
MGATTIWERWDSMLPDGSINPGEMTSFNHYALGAVSDWMHRTIGGLIPAEPGYHKIEFRPQPGGGLTTATTKHHTPYGIAACDWKLTDGQIQVEIEVPANTRAVVFLPGKPENEALDVGSGTYAWTYAYTQTFKKRTRLTLDSTVGELLDNSEALPLALKTISAYDSRLIERMLAQEQIPIRQTVSYMMNRQALLASLEETFASLKPD